MRDRASGGAGSGDVPNVCEGPGCMRRFDRTCCPALRCGNCKCAFYCSRDCQKNAWREHKEGCCTLVVKHPRSVKLAIWRIVNTHLGRVVFSFATLEDASYCHIYAERFARSRICSGVLRFVRERDTARYTATNPGALVVNLTEFRALFCNNPRGPIGSRLLSDETSSARLHRPHVVGPCDVCGEPTMTLCSICGVAHVCSNGCAHGPSPDPSHHPCDDLDKDFVGYSWSSERRVPGIPCLSYRTIEFERPEGRFHVLHTTWARGVSDISTLWALGASASLFRCLITPGGCLPLGAIRSAVLVRSQASWAHWGRSGNVSPVKQCKWFDDLRIHAPCIPSSISSQVFAELGPEDVARGGDIVIKPGGTVYCVHGVFVRGDASPAFPPWDVLRRD